MEQVANEKVEAVWNIYQAAFLEIPYTKQKNFMKKCSYRIGMLERRISRKKTLDTHQILNDMPELHKRAADIGYTVANKETQLLGKYRHALRKLIRLDIAFLQMMAPSASLEGFGKNLYMKSIKMII